jgi:hypothetical protein
MISSSWTAQMTTALRLFCRAATLCPGAQIKSSRFCASRRCRVLLGWWQVVSPVRGHEKVPSGGQV